MLYTKSHVLALEAQITYLKAELEKAKTGESAQVAYLKAELEKVQSRESALLDRLLAKNNVESLTAQPVKVPEPTQLITPFGNVNTPEVAEAYKRSWIEEEAVHLMAEEGIADAQAHEMAERRFITQHKAT